MNAMTDVNRGPRRLEPAMASFRLLVLAFVRQYISEHGEGPSYGEIAAKLDSNRERVRKAVKRLVKDGQLIRTPGERGLKLPGVIDESIRQLREAGWVINEEAREGYLPVPVTIRPLLPPIELRYPARGSDERRDGNGHQAA